MDLHNLKPAEGSTHREKRIGRGQGSGHGGTSTRGHKGAKSRSGYSKKVGFEGGQMPIHRRLPKFGFTNINRKEFKGINIGTIQMVAEKMNISVVDVDTLVSVGLARKNDKVKILGNGTLTSKVEVKAHAFSDSAVKAIEAQKGTVVKL
jgi:large subunit ribosomal protein L15